MTPSAVAEPARTAVAADPNALQALAIPTLLIGFDGRIREVSESARKLLPNAAVGAPFDALLSIPLDELRSAAEASPPRALPVALHAAAGTVLTLVQGLPVADGLMLLLISLEEVRKAEEKRFETTPYCTIRVGLDGNVRFANPAAKRLWSGKEMEGCSFIGLFPSAFQDDIRAKLREVIATGESRSIEFTTGVYLEVGGRQLHSEPRLIMLPEFATGSTLRSVLVVIRERALDAIRVGLREAALGIAATEPSPEPGSVAPSAWQHRARGVLDLLREVLPHDLAIIQEVSSHGDWVRPILMHPEPQQRWPRMWWRVAESERGLLDAPAPFAIELADWLRNNPDRQDEPMLKLLLEARPNGKPMASFAVMPIRPFGRTESVLVLASAEPGHFQFSGDPGPAWEDEELPRDPLAILGRLGLDTLLARMLRHARRDDEVARTSIAASIESAETVPEAALALLRQLVDHFGWDHAAVFAANHVEEGEAFRLFAQYPEIENDKPHPLAIPRDYVQPLYDPAPGEPFDEARARLSGMLGAAVRDARHGGTGVLVAPDTAELDATGRPPHWFRSVGIAQRSALTIAITINGRTRWVLDTISRHSCAFIEEDGARVAPLVQRLAARISALRDRKLNDRLIHLIDEGILITDESGVILRANLRARELLGLPPDNHRTDQRLSDFVHEPQNAELPRADREERTLVVGPIGGLGVEARIRRLEDTTETTDIIWLMSGADRETYNVNTRYISETVQEVARQVRSPLLLAASLCGRMGRGAAQDRTAAMAKQARAEIAKADITFERLAEAMGARQTPKREDRAVALSALLTELNEALPKSDSDRLRMKTGGALMVTGDRSRLAFALRTLVGNMLARDTGSVSVDLRDVGGQAKLALSAPEIPPTTENATPEDVVRAEALEAATHAQDSVRAVLAAPGGGLESTPDGFLLHLPLARGSGTRS